MRRRDDGSRFVLLWKVTAPIFTGVAGHKFLGRALVSDEGFGSDARRDYGQRRGMTMAALCWET